MLSLAFQRRTALVLYSSCAVIRSVSVGMSFLGKATSSPFGMTYQTEEALSKFPKNSYANV